ncbi:MAG: hypothetical protein JNK90_02880 [Planctomycetaceae bacterium]|nr:hypothetical protein [Planctomycetaceae bacterium]
MKDAANRLSRPVAQFVVERIPGTGYCVTSSIGEESSILDKEAVALLDKIQEPSKEPNHVTNHWIGPIRREGYFVGVSITPTTDGLFRFQQTWFKIEKQRWSNVIICVLVLTLLTGLGLGSVVGKYSVNSEFNKTIDKKLLDLQTREQEKEDSELTFDKDEFLKLKDQIVSTEKLRTKLKGYLQQDGLAADPSLKVTEAQRAVKIIADLDRSPPSQESIRLNNLEVLALLNLLDQLGNLETGK